MADKPPFLVVAERQEQAGLKGLTALTPDEYLEGKAADAVAEGTTVVNLCRSYQYLSRGYYVSLLADARNQRAMPSLRLIEEITNPYAYFTALRGAGIETIGFKVVKGRRVLPKLIAPASGKEMGGHAAPETPPGSSAPEATSATQPPPDAEPPLGAGARDPLMTSNGGTQTVRYVRKPGDYEDVTCIFGRTLDPRFRKHCAGVFRVFPFPLLKIRLYRDDDRWKVGQLDPLSPTQLGPAELALLAEGLASGKVAAGWASIARARPHRIAVLMDEKDPFAPSNDETFEKLRRLGERRGVLFEKIGKEDLPVLPEYEALFLRTVTGMDHFSFLFAQRAKSLGMPVIDEPQSTVRCSNKVYLHELFRKVGLPTPRTLTVSRKSPLAEVEALGYPLIIKSPDGTFSASVRKAANRKEMEKLTREMFKHSPLLTIQEFLPTEFDWRVGILDGNVLFVCKYHMVKGHWQIVSKSRTGRPRYGAVEAVKAEDAPEAVKSLALSAAALIGDGLYGVDLKDSDSGPIIIEINDNPDIWVGEEDAAEGDRLYEQIISCFVRRINETLSGVISE